MTDRFLTDRYVIPFTDLGFKLIFGTEINKELLISFVNSLFDGKEVIKDLTYLNTEHKQKELQLQNKHKMSLSKQEQALSMLAMERDNANATAKKLNRILNFFAQIIYKSDEIFRRAIHGIIDFTTSCRIACSHRDILHNEEAYAIKTSMEKLANDIISKKDVGWFIVNFAKEKGKLTEE